MHPKLIALDTDWTIFEGWLDGSVGTGPNGSRNREDNLVVSDSNPDVVLDKSDTSRHWRLYPEAAHAISDMLSNGCQLAIVTRNVHRNLCDRILWLFQTWDPNQNQRRPIIDLIQYDECYPAKDIIGHFENIKRYSGLDYSEMLFFDDDAQSSLAEFQLGVTFKVLRDSQGLTIADYRAGVEMWYRNKMMKVPYVGQDLGSYCEPMFIGYAGMDGKTVELLTQGKRRLDRAESARWGYAMYITDNVHLAQYFREWIKRDTFGNVPTYLCALWVRDRNTFINMAKIWIPEDPGLMTDNKRTGQNVIAWTQENRDRAVLQRYGVSKPYVLHARHHWMEGMPLPRGQRWNEMVVYPQIQEALFLTFPMTPQQVGEAQMRWNNGQDPRYNDLVQAWNITVPQDTIVSCRRHGDPVFG